MGEMKSRRDLWGALVIFITCLFFFSLMNYGGVRSPDSEIVFRMAESIENGHGLDVPNQIEIVPGFGLAYGTDGGAYSIFGPVESFVLVPLIKMARAINSSGWYDSTSLNIPISHWVGPGINHILLRQKPDNPEPHALRFIVSLFVPLISSLGVLFFWLILRRLGVSTGSATITAFLYAFGTIAFHYSSTFFSEPLALLFILVSFYLLVGRTSFGCRGLIKGFSSGFVLGLATATHLSAALFIPFFMLISGCSGYVKDRQKRDFIAVACAFSLGVILVLGFLGYYNYARFGSLLETGRGVDPEAAVRFGYGQFTAPWQGLYQLLFGPYKGLFLFCPAVILGIICWRYFHRKHRMLSYLLIGSIVFRLIFIACRSDWHGGLSLGPRYLLMITPFMLIGTAFWLEEQIYAKRFRQMWIFLGAAAFCVVQQVYFCIGEIFTYLHLSMVQKLSLGQPVLGSSFYLTWPDSPLFNLLDQTRGPFLLQDVPLSNTALWLIFTVIILAVVGLILRHTRD